MSTPLRGVALHHIGGCSQAANYLSVGQVYVLDRPLLMKPLPKKHIKPRLLGHRGTTPGLNLVNAHLNRIIRLRDFSRWMADLFCDRDLAHDVRKLESTMKRDVGGFIAGLCEAVKRRCQSS